MITRQTNTFREQTLKIPFSKVAIWGVMLFSALAIMFLFFGFEFYHKILGAIFLLCVLICFKYEYGFEITESFEVRNYYKVFNHVFGRWKSIPEIKYITVIKVFQYDWNVSRTAKILTRKNTHQVNLVFRNKRQQKINSFKNMKTAETVGIELRAFLDVKLYLKT